ncbi:50S ribosomal protein L4, partial [bacterium]|nr:50S ribosomal protein L4 [bacterium]
TTLLPKEIFDVKMNPDLLHQTVVSQMTNRRQVLAHTKDRSEVRGGGRKPWRQKGTGRARHGSIRSPLWKGGGVTFGPTKERVFKRKINKKARKQALFMVLSAKVKNNLLLILDLDLKQVPSKTKQMAEIFKKLPLKGSALIALPKIDQNFIKSTKNIPQIETIEARNLNALDLLLFKHLILLKESIKIIQNNFTSRR